MAEPQFNINALRALAGNFAEEDDTARNLLARQQYYNALLNPNPMAYGRERSFMPLGEAELRGMDPRILASLRGGSTRQEFIEGLGMQNVPAMLLGRLGLEGDVGSARYRAGANLAGMQMPYSGEIRQMPTAFDVGVRGPLFGGEFDVGGSVVPKEGMMPQTMYNIQARYNKKF